MHLLQLSLAQFSQLLHTAIAIVTHQLHHTHLEWVLDLLRPCAVARRCRQPPRDARAQPRMLIIVWHTAMCRSCAWTQYKHVLISALERQGDTTSMCNADHVNQPIMTNGRVTITPQWQTEALSMQAAVRVRFS